MSNLDLISDADDSVPLFHGYIGSRDDYKEMEDDNSSLIVRFYKKHQIKSISFNLIGSGDSGCAELGYILKQNNRVHYNEIAALSQIVHVRDDFSAVTMEEFLTNIVENIPEGNWYNNEGGQGEVALILFQEEDNTDVLCVHCDMEYNDECCEDEDFDDDDEEDQTIELDESFDGETIDDDDNSVDVDNSAQIVIVDYLIEEAQRNLHQNIDGSHDPDLNHQNQKNMR
jgi:hypothetical protein